MEHTSGIGSRRRNAVIVLNVDIIPEKEGVYQGAPNTIRTDSHGEEDLVRIAETANQLIPCKGTIVVCVLVTIVATDGAT